MELTAHGVWTMVHGMGFGALYLLACSGAMVELWRHTSSSRGAPDRTADDTFLRVYLATMAVLADCVNEALDGALAEFLAANAAHNNPSRLARALRWVAQFPASGGHCVRMRLANGDVPSDETTSEQTVVTRFSFKTEGGVGGAEVVLDLRPGLAGSDEFVAKMESPKGPFHRVRREIRRAIAEEIAPFCLA